MNKQDAVAYLEREHNFKVSTRSLENYVADGLLPVDYVPGKTRPVADFTPDDLDELPKRLEERHNKVTAMVKAKHDDSQALARAPRGLQELIAAISSQVPKRAQLSERMLLSLPEAAELSGVPVEHLRRAVHKKKLKTVHVGRGLGKVKRSALEMFVKQLQ